MSMGIAFDIGTSGFRVQLVDLETKKVLRTAITLRHPLPGANVMDHLNFAIRVGEDIAHKLMIDAFERILSQMRIDRETIERIAICGNPIQLSLFEGISIKDLAYADPKYLEAEKIKIQSRNAKVISSKDLGIRGINADILIPPAIKHEIGADALAMMLKSNFLDNKEISLVTDYGTNAEMALKVGDKIFTGSAASGPALEGQEVSCGMLASPGAISDIVLEFGWHTLVLDENMLPQSVRVLDLWKEEFRGKKLSNVEVRGITGTGVVSVIYAGLETGVIELPYIYTKTKRLRLDENIYFTEEDLKEAGKAIGAIRAGHLTLAQEAEIQLEDVKTMYMCGASGTYVDATKSRKIGLIPPTIQKVYQVGNTSLLLAFDVLVKNYTLEELQKLADKIRSKHIMFATSKIFTDVYVQELAYWEQGMSFEKYNEMLVLKNIQTLPPVKGDLEVNKIVKRDIPDIGQELKVIDHIGVELVAEFENCQGCGKCERVCPERALKVEALKGGNFKIRILSERCNGEACLRCQSSCPYKVFKFEKLTESIDR
ncbi:MAG: quinol dehydrogenase membrane component [Candidatus Methanofastidiosum methylothiophilum]|jgi:methylamine methyltransferase corrinoid protein reductive activase|uniref:Quinol dehydrogenase membrane component n=1 Tax=Candidatus Methanofastidiosum methylothiophilum TaxID=1705564 RepID=A0A150JN18_9EURY|nr:MAG: quinol dehydrogenase membrane component [Candidatus Methanofastidiosum methylthiophilus]MBP6932404.1 methylamine methyltransferase corrinoid protein reductive activase [Methanofastidiosum sp.]OQC52278.1 MAG: quinol dehydrogenase membrane component [Euryarchaeota archaeon ADurb.Bin023]KYC57603.1 MAG: quinol dehydrogenase membrane component [Candidatus Methanofastidiosum methylthiophilus]KYC58508.1 MAG: quinol dehydrogenase membrane component [Candidatus Methanofastidiosum methylthiophilu